MAIIRSALLLSFVVCCLPASQGKQRASFIVHSARPAERSVFERGLVSEHVHYKSVLFEHSRHWEDVTKRHFNGTVLAYVTPWNSKGYDMAVKFRSKFTHVAPVWYQLRGLPTGLKLEGQHDVDLGWIQRLRDGSGVKVVPRVVVEGPHIRDMVADDDVQSAALDLVASECLKNEYDGIVLEAWAAWMQAGVLDSESSREKALGFVRNLADLLRAASPTLELFLVVPTPGLSPNPHHVFTPDDVVALAPHVGGFSLMTYDFSAPGSPGPNAPIQWVQSCLQYLLPHVKPVHKHEDGLDASWPMRELLSVDDSWGRGGDELAGLVLLGLNFYGYKHVERREAHAIVGHEYLKLVDQHRPTLHWDDSAKEHHITYATKTGAKHDIYYPTLNSISTRLEEARAWGTGISIWEIGQGLDFFFDLL